MIALRRLEGRFARLSRATKAGTRGVTEPGDAALIRPIKSHNR